MFTILGIVTFIFFLFVFPVILAYFGKLESDIYAFISGAFHFVLGVSFFVFGIAYNSVLVFYPIFTAFSLFVLFFDDFYWPFNYKSPHSFILKKLDILKKGWNKND